MRPGPSSKEWSLVAFTVLAQAAAGACIVQRIVALESLRIDTATQSVLSVALLLLLSGGLAALLHLGRARSARFALANLQRSPLSEEMLYSGFFGALLVLGRLSSWASWDQFAALTGVILLGAIIRVYRLRTVPAWHSWTTLVAFFGTALVLGAGIVMTALAFAGLDNTSLRYTIAAAIAIQLLVLHRHLAALARAGGAAAESATIVREDLRSTLDTRLFTAIAGGLIVFGAPYLEDLHPVATLVGVAILGWSEAQGRALFYAMRRRVGL